MGEESVKIDRAALLRIAGRAVHGADSTITPEDAAAVLEAVGYRHYSESYDYETGEGLIARPPISGCMLTQHRKI